MVTNGRQLLGLTSDSLSTRLCHLTLLKRAAPRGQERARNLGRASSRGPEAPIVVYNDPARSRGQTRSPRRRTGCSNRPYLCTWNFSGFYPGHPARSPRRRVCRLYRRHPHLLPEPGGALPSCCIGTRAASKCWPFPQREKVRLRAH
ncbi:hypothetical protein IEO21_08293 [Rhodonia placenta]|uniref:Uncharacterized protein n=1 Tax=Rhodonia placenta TaxID=104341 RepID=A0A8H7TZD3_9APHY|nr:hypothetical protein IEO21_08293 [Postia placenta]